MKKTVFVSLMLASSFALAAKSKAKAVSFENFADAVDQFQFDGGAEPSGCFFTVKKLSNGLELQLAGDQDLTAYIATDAAISVQSKSDGDDSQETYYFPGGSVVLQSISDAFNRVYLTTEDGTASCEQDM